MIYQVELPDELAAKVNTVFAERPFDSSISELRKFSQFEREHPEATQKEWVEHILKGYLRFIYVGHQAIVARYNKFNEAKAEFDGAGK